MTRSLVVSPLQFLLALAVIPYGIALVASPPLQSRPFAIAAPSLVMTMGNRGRQRKRDIIQKWGSGLGGTSTGKRLSLISLDQSNNDNDEQEKNDFLDKIKAKIPVGILEMFQQFWSKICSAFPSVRTAVISFIAGATLMLAAILVPVYSEVETLTEPVTLFETILGDLDRGYVDQVDTQKLFETGVSAMLRTLDPYTEFESKQDAQDLSESIGGRYGGVGLVISGAAPRDMQLLNEMQKEDASSSKLLPQDAINNDGGLGSDGDVSSSSLSSFEDDNDDDDGASLQERLEQRRAMEKAKSRGIRVVSAFEGYAFDYGMRVGDKLVAIDGKPISPGTSVDDVRNMLRGEPETTVDVSFERVGVRGVNTITMPRTIVQIRDVKLATLLGNPKDGVGYIQLTGFAANAGREMRQAIVSLQRAAEEASGGERSLQGLILDLRGNPGGLLTQAVDVSSLLVPKGSDIVSARGRGFPGVLYRSRVDPILDSNTKLAVLVNGGTASAAEIVSGAVQDLDAGIIVGADRTFGKGLVQNVEELPFNTALKFTVAKYYTPSGRCIQGINYKEGGGLNKSDGKYQAKRVADKDKGVFYTKRGRQVKDSGGIEADYKVTAPKASALEVTLLRSGVLADFAAQWSKTHELTNNFDVDEGMYKEFQAFVNKKQKEGEIKLESLYNGPLAALKDALKKSGYKGSAKELEQLQTRIVQEVQKDFEKYRTDIKEDISQSILARYLPESMLIERGVKTDKQVNAAVKLLANGRKFDQLLARGSIDENIISGSTMSTASADSSISEKGARIQMKW